MIPYDFSGRHYLLFLCSFICFWTIIIYILTKLSFLEHILYAKRCTWCPIKGNWGGGTWGQGGRRGRMKTKRKEKVSVFFLSRNTQYSSRTSCIQLVIIQCEMSCNTHMWGTIGAHEKITNYLSEYCIGLDIEGFQGYKGICPCLPKAYNSVIKLNIYKNNSVLR